MKIERNGNINIMKWKLSKANKNIEIYQWISNDEKMKKVICNQKNEVYNKWKLKYKY